MDGDAVRKGTALLGLELVVVLGAAVLAGSLLGARFRIAPPVLLLAAGVLAGFIPALRTVQLPPQAVLLLFLPALLFWESLTTSLREIRSNLRGIVLVSTLLVIATAAAVAATAHALGLPWGPAWVLGGAVAPTDATVVGVVARLLPSRNLTILRAESLVNDGTALVVYGLAVGITVGAEHLSVLHVGGLFLRAYAGGVAAGAVVAWIGLRVRGRLEDPLLGNTASALIPFTAYLLAESVDASGVLAVVTAGLILSQAGPRVGQAATRHQAEAFWSLGTFWLNGALFVLVGLELQSAVRGLTSEDIGRGLVTVLVVSVVLVAVRIAFLFVSAYAIRALDRRPSQRLRRVSHRSRIVSGLAGFRGAVSLAAALAVPATVDSGAPFPDRDTVVFVTAGVIVVTLLQGLVLPGVVRWARLPQDTRVQEERHLAETVMTEEALALMPDLAARYGTGPAVVDRLSEEFTRHLLVLNADSTALDDDPAAHHELQYSELRLALIARKRATLVRLRDERRIDDIVLRQIQSALDVEEVRLTRRGPVD